MRIGFIATRLSGTDGVLLEVAKWARVLQRLGHETFYYAGELGGYATGGTLIPKMHFLNEEFQRINGRAFGLNADKDPHPLLDEIGLQRILFAVKSESSINKTVSHTRSGRMQIDDAIGEHT